MKEGKEEKKKKKKKKRGKVWRLLLFGCLFGFALGFVWILVCSLSRV